jgi:hypothetical protein
LTEDGYRRFADAAMKEKKFEEMKEKCKNNNKKLV